MTAPEGTLRHATFAQLDPAILYDLLRLRIDVFVVEQRCAYPELDGRDTEPTTRHLWIDHDGTVVAYLRLLAPPGVPARIGRVVTAPSWRGRGAAERLVRAAVGMVGGAVVLDAQAHLQGWYERLGFVVRGPGFDEHGIAHVPMSLGTMR